MTGNVADEFFVGHAPELGLSQEGRRSADRSEDFAVGGEGDRFDPLRLSDQPADQPRAVRLVQQHLVEARNGQKRAVGRISQRRDHRRAGIFRRILGRHRILHAGRRVVLGPLADPLADQFDLRRLERLAVFGHLGLWTRDVLDDEAFVGLSGNERGPVLAPRLEAVVGRQQELAAPFGRLMAAAARSLQDRTDLAVEADGAGLLRRAFLIGRTGVVGQSGRRAQAQSPRSQIRRSAERSPSHRPHAASLVARPSQSTRQVFDTSTNR